MIPPFDDETGLLPAGEHYADWGEITDRFGWNAHRRHILKGLLRLVTALRDGGCRLCLLDGSFVTRKELPSDFDAACDYNDMEPLALLRLRLTASSEIMKAEYRGEVFPCNETVPSDGRYTFREYFQRDDDDTPKGIIAVNLASVP